jgi:hypothetical protein
MTAAVSRTSVRTLFEDRPSRGELVPGALRRHPWRAAAGAALVVVLTMSFAARHALTQLRRYDERFDARVDRPAFASAGPIVTFDTGHYEVHTPSTSYRPFASLLASDGAVDNPPIAPGRRWCHHSPRRHVS